MAQKLLTRRKLLLAKVESTYNTDPTPSASADAVLCEGLSWASAGLKMIARPAIRPSFGELRQVYGGRLLQVSFSCEVKGSGTAGTAPEIGQLLRACAMGETIVGATSVTYAPVSTGVESCTLWVYEDGKQIKITGCRGNVSFTATAGERVMAAFTLTGHEGAQADVTLATPTYSSIVPAPVIAGGFTIDSFAAVISSLTFDLTNTVAMPANVSAADGYSDVTITARDVNGSIDPLDELVAAEDFIGNFKSGSIMALTTGAIGATAGNILTIAMPAVSYRDVTPADRDGLAAFDLPFGAAEDSADDEVTLAFT